MQTVTSDRTKITDASFAKGFGEYDLWELWLLDEAEDVPCGSILTFLHYLCSEGTKHCEILDASTLATGFVDIRLTGPLAGTTSATTSYSTGSPAVVRGGLRRQRRP